MQQSECEKLEKLRNWGQPARFLIALPNADSSFCRVDSASNLHISLSSEFISALFNHIRLSITRVSKNAQYPSIKESGALPAESRIDQEGPPREPL